MRLCGFTARNGEIDLRELVGYSHGIWLDHQKLGYKIDERRMYFNEHL